MLTLRDYQAEIIGQVDELENPIIPLPTGGDKTVIAAEIIRTTVERGERVIFNVHRRELVLQASAKLLANGVDHAILMGSESSFYLSQPCIVASVQTLYARAFRTSKLALPPADVIFFDEAHHCRPRTYLKIRKAYPRAKIIGLTATPARGDGRGLGGDLFSSLVKVPTYRWLIEQNFLVPPVVFAPVRPDLKGVRTVDTGDYSSGELEERMNTHALVGGIIEHWFKLGQNRSTIIFTAGVKHSAHLQREFEKAGVAAEHLDATTVLGERKRIIAGFRSGEIKILCNCMILTGGFDEPSAACLVLARPTKLLTMYRQMVGRILRPHSGKVDARILGHSGAVYRHGYPDDEIEWTLDPDETAVNQSEAARAVSGHKRELTTCPSCMSVRMEGEACGVCGCAPTTRPRYLDVRDGQLGQVDRGLSAHTPHYTQDDESRQFHRQLLRIAQERGRKPGWAAYAFKEKFGIWPEAKPWALPQPETPSPALRAWVRARDIAFARSMGGSR